MDFGSNTIIAFDGFGTITAIYPDFDSIARELDVATKEVRIAVEEGVPIRGNYFEYCGSNKLKSRETAPKLEQYDPISGETVNRFSTIREAARILGIKYDQIRYPLNSDHRDVFGMKWRKRQ